MITVVFACVHNAGRSQMAAAFARQLVDPGRVRVLSAGTNPGKAVHPEVVQVMDELGVVLDEPPRLFDAKLQASANLVITMGCGEACPAVPPERRLDWVIPDPKGQPLATVRQIREDIWRRVLALVEERDWAP